MNRQKQLLRTVKLLSPWICMFLNISHYSKVSFLLTPTVNRMKSSGTESSTYRLEVGEESVYGAGCRCEGNRAMPGTKRRPPLALNFSHLRGSHKNPSSPYPTQFLRNEHLRPSHSLGISLLSGFLITSNNMAFLPDRSCSSAEN